jgi:hypothetical protein
MYELLAGDEHPPDDVGVSGNGERFSVRSFQLAAEQSALRSVAMLVTAGAEPSEVFDAATEGLGRCVHGAKAGLWRFEASGEITTVAGAAEPAKLVSWPVGSRQPVEGSYLASTVQSTGRPARCDSYQGFSAPLAARVQVEGILSGVAVPVIVGRRVWGFAAVGSIRPGPMPADTEARIGGFTELIATAVTARIHDEQERRLFDEGRLRTALMDAFLQGRILDRWSVWDAANSLQLPCDGPFVVIAAEMPAVGTLALPEIQSKLRSLDVYSAWRVLPDLQVGIVYVGSDQQLDRVLELLSRTTRHRVGVSARFDDLRDAPQALHVAKVTLRGHADSRGPVALFDGSILATAAVSAPAIMLKSVKAVLDGFDDLPDRERELLFETFRLWQESPSVSVMAEVLFCHPNTVRHRLRRIEQRTGRSLSSPRDVAELCLAFEVHRRLM